MARDVFFLVCEKSFLQREKFLSILYVCEFTDMD